jgi:hypothetical protein
MPQQRKSFVVRKEFTQPTKQASSYILDNTGGFGSLVLSAQTAGLVVARLVTASKASYTLTPQTATLIVAHKITAAFASFTLTPETATLAVARTITAGFTSFTLTAKTAGLVVARLITASPASFTLTPQTATLVVTPHGGTAYTLTALFGSFVLTAETASLVVARLVTASPAFFTLTPQSASLVVVQAPPPPPPFQPGGGSIIFGGTEWNTQWKRPAQKKKRKVVRTAAPAPAQPSIIFKTLPLENIFPHISSAMSATIPASRSRLEEIQQKVRKLPATRTLYNRPDPEDAKRQRDEEEAALLLL